MRKLLLPVFLLVHFFAAAQQPLVIFRKASAFTGTEACLLGYLRAQGLLAPGANRFYLLHRDSAWLVDQAVERGDTLRRQLHVTDHGGACTARWTLRRAEWIRRGVYRANPAFLYAPYFEKYDPFSGDHAAAGSAGKMGFLNTEGEWIIAPDYDDLKPHALGIWVKNARGVQLIDVLASGDRSEVYDDIATSFARTGPDEARFTAVRRGNRVGALGRNRRLLVPLQYDDLRNLSMTYLLGLRNHQVTVLDPATGKELTPFYDDARIVPDSRLLEVKVNGRTQVIDPYNLATRRRPVAPARTKGACACGEPAGHYLTLHVQGDSIVPCQEGHVTVIGHNHNQPLEWTDALRDTTLLFSSSGIGTLWDCGTAQPISLDWREYYVKSRGRELWIEPIFPYDSLQPDGQWKLFLADRPALREVFTVQNGHIGRKGLQWILQVPQLAPRGVELVHTLLAQNRGKVEENELLLHKLIVAALNGDALSRSTLMALKSPHDKSLVAFYQLLLRMQPTR